MVVSDSDQLNRLLFRPLKQLELKVIKVIKVIKSTCLQHGVKVLQP